MGPVLDMINVRIIPWIVAGAALIAGVALLVETPLVRWLRPWIVRRELPSNIFAVSMVTLAVAVTFCSARRIHGVIRDRRTPLKADLWKVGVFTGTFVAVFIAQIYWLDGTGLFARAIDRDASVSLLAMVLQTSVPLLTIGALVGYCFNTALAGPALGPSPTSECELAIGRPYDYQWFDVAPRRPFMAVAQERRGKTLPVVLVYAVTGIVAGYVMWPQEWPVPSVLCGILGLVAAWFYVGIAHREYRHRDLSQPVTGLVFRRAFIRDDGGQLDFVVIEENGTPSGKVQLQRPWNDVTGFVKSRYGAVFESTNAQPFDVDWNVIIMAPAVGMPLLVSETFEGEGSVYQLLSELASRFGPEARAKCLLEREGSARREQAKSRSGMPEEL